MKYYIKTEYNVIKAHLFRTYKTHLLIRLNVVLLYYLQRDWDRWEKEDGTDFNNLVSIQEIFIYILLIAYHLAK